jgi:hypothetical protein
LRRLRRSVSRRPRFFADTPQDSLLGVCMSAAAGCAGANHLHPIRSFLIESASAQRVCGRVVENFF